jgi:glycogen(starch) synthase
MSHARRPLYILYAAGPGDVMGTYQHWKAGRDDPSEVSRTYSGQFFDVCRELGAKGHAITTRGDRTRLVDGDILIENRPVRGLKGGGARYHLGQLGYGLRLALTALHRRADVAVISTGTHWFALSVMALMGVRIVPALHCALWPAGRPPTGRIPRIAAKLDGWFWRYIASATICVSPECERQVRDIAGAVRGPMYQVRAQYRRGYLDALLPPKWPGEQPFCVMYAGRIERVKGVFVLLEVARQLHAKDPGRFRWEIFGGRPAQGVLAAASKVAGLEQIFVLRGKLDRAAIADAF